MERLNGLKGEANLPVFLVGAGTLALAAGMVASKQPDALILLVVAFLVLFSLIDTLWHRIPNLVTVPAMVIGLGIGFFKDGAPGGGTALAGLLLGGAILLPFYLMNVVGAGDVKALAGVGALLGPSSLVQVVLWMGLIGGGVALFYLTTGWIRPRWKVRFFPYAPVMALGTMAWMGWGEVLAL